MSALLLFDIDGTLLLTGGAGIRSMTRAFEEVFGVSRAFADLPAAGRTDSWLLSQALGRAGLPDTPDAHTRFRAAYIETLAEEIHRPGSGRKAVMPGVPELLDRLAADRRLHLALLTGNYERAAGIKLRHFALQHYFAWGAFGEEAADRNELARIAVARAASGAVPPPACRNVVVIGDTTHDIACARAAGARAVAVATGGSRAEELRAAGADVVLADFCDAEAVVELLL